MTVYNSNTVIIELKEGVNSYRVDKIELYGIDTGMISMDSLYLKLSGKDVVLEKFPLEGGVSYGIIYLNGKNFNEWILNRRSIR